MRHALLVLLSLGTVVAPVRAQHAVQQGDPKVAAQSAIGATPDRHLCPVVSVATRLVDGSIRAVCNTGETFVVLNRNGQAVAMRCSVARREGIVC
ncbi:MAG TPA: hypothetical protein VD970_16170 [Acetobacteraceae bacterium]|nr:hypothetical protein [Acetobacteraceae bacterium]